MKKKIIIFNVVLFTVIVAIIAVIVLKAKQTDAESKEYVDASVVSIVSDWSKEELIKRASPELIAAVSEDDLDKVFTLYRKLGKFREYKGSEGGSNVSLTTQHGKVISAGYTASAEFEAGPAQIKVDLIKHGENWQILSFYVDSKVFLDLN